MVVVAAAAVLATILATPIPIVAMVAGLAVLAYLGVRAGVARGAALRIEEANPGCPQS